MNWDMFFSILLVVLLLAFVGAAVINGINDYMAEGECRAAGFEEGYMSGVAGGIVLCFNVPTTEYHALPDNSR
jgi:hypothetical protein